MDVYGLGATLAHLVTLQPPWDSLPGVSLILEERDHMYRSYLERIGSGAAAVERFTNNLLTKTIKQEVWILYLFTFLAWFFST